MMKKKAAILVATVMMFSLAACGDTGQTAGEGNDSPGAEAENPAGGEENGGRSATHEKGCCFLAPSL